MSTVTSANRFTDFDRLLLGKNLLLTILGAGIAFALEYLQAYIEFPYPPYGLSLSIAVMLAAAVATRNIGSSILIGLIGSMGLITVSKNGEFVTADFILGYIIMNVFVILYVAKYTDRIKRVTYWSKFYLVFAFLTALVSIGLGILFAAESEKYTDQSIDIGLSIDLGYDIGVPLFDVAVFVGITLLLFISFFMLRGQVLLTDSSITKYKVFGTLFFLLGQALFFVPMVLFSTKIDRDSMLAVTESDAFLTTIDDLFTHHGEGLYAVFGEPFNIFLVFAVSMTFTLIGIATYQIGVHGGNLSKVRAGTNSVFLAAPLAVMIFFAYSSVYVQSLIFPGGFYLALDQFPVVMTLLCSVFMINQLAARIILFIMKPFRLA